MKSKRQIQKEKTKTKIVETAYQVYSQQGFTATSKMIAAAAGVSHGTIFVHFPSMEDLLEQLIEQFGESLTLDMHDLAERNDSIETLLVTYLEKMSKYENFYLHLISEKNLLPEGVQLSLANIWSTIAFHFNHVIEREIENKTVKNIPVHMIFNIWMGLVHYYLLNKNLFSPDEPLLPRYSSEMISAFVELIHIR